MRIWRSQSFILVGEIMKRRKRMVICLSLICFMVIFFLESYPVTIIHQLIYDSDNNNYSNASYKYMMQYRFYCGQLSDRYQIATWLPYYWRKYPSGAQISCMFDVFWFDHGIHHSDGSMTMIIAIHEGQMIVISAEPDKTYSDSSAQRMISSYINEINMK